MGKKTRCVAMLVALCMMVTVLPSVSVEEYEVQRKLVQSY